MEKKPFETEESQSLDMKTLLHELKNPITALMFQIDSLRETLPTKYQDSLDSLGTEVQRLADLTNGAGSFLKDAEGKPEKLDVCMLLTSIVGNSLKPVKLFCNSSCFIFMDADRARSVFENLIRNACESSEDKNSEVDVEVTSSLEQLTVKIKDRGTGIDADTIGRLFDFGFTTKEKGSGIGLFLARHFVEAAKGSLQLYPRDNGGTISEVVLPIYKN